ncbi:MAG TPA: diphthamide biosynthesis enzyme Dph2 [Ignisphaera sp.]|nr:diphthamide biosynthesis enzyme Dph2 [Ignisphaera sp.]
MSPFCEDYDFELEHVASVITATGAKRILIQLPEGLQKCSEVVVSELRKHAGSDVDIFVSLNPSYGACLVDEYTADSIGADLIVHFGHLEYPYYKPRKRTIFIPVEYRGADRDKILNVLMSVCADEAGKVCLVTTAQHIKLVNEVVHALAKHCSIEFRDTILGCKPANTWGCGKTVVIAGGKFHCITQALYAINDDVLCLDPYTYNLWNPKKDAERILRVRYWKMYNARDARKWLLIDGMYGQSRPEVLHRITELLRNQDRNYVVAKVLRLDEYVLRNIGIENFDAIVVLSCPRIAIDDLEHIEVPVLTPGEALMLLEGKLEEYRYPW